MLNERSHSHQSCGGGGRGWEMVAVLPTKLHASALIHMPHFQQYGSVSIAILRMATLLTIMLFVFAKLLVLIVKSQIAQENKITRIF